MNGFENENMIIYEINNKSFKYLSNDLQKVIKYINKGKIPESISAQKYGGISKADLSITIDGTEYFISVKKGTGNSVHQERIESFIYSLETKHEKDESVFNDLRHFIWGDDTLDGQGKANERISANEYKKKYPNRIDNIQSYFDKYRKDLLIKFLFTGSSSTSNIDYIFYGDINECFIVNKDDLLKFALNNAKKPISIGALNFQAWNRNINGGDKSEKKRGQIQLKWGNLKDYIKNI